MIRLVSSGGDLVASFMQARDTAALVRGSEAVVKQLFFQFFCPGWRAGSSVASRFRRDFGRVARVNHQKRQAGTAIVLGFLLPQLRLTPSSVARAVQLRRICPVIAAG